jgi:mannose-6-phosphate isomerase-like protein (cupin superfamily)
MEPRVVLLGAGNTIAIAAGAAESNGAFALLDYELAPGFSALPPHVHQREDAAIYVLEGRLQVQLGRAKRLVGPGEFIFLPRGIVQAQSNPGSRPVRFLVLLVPGGFESCYPALEALQMDGDLGSSDALTTLLAAYGVRSERAGVPFGQQHTRH